MKNVKPNNKKTAEYLAQLPEVHLVGCWARYGVWSYPFSGKYKKVKYDNVIRYIPLVWQYDDKNGTVDNFYLRPIDFTTSGRILFWTFNKNVAEEVAEALNAVDVAKQYKKSKDLTELMYKWFGHT